MSYEYPVKHYGIISRENPFFSNYCFKKKLILRFILYSPSIGLMFWLRAIMVNYVFIFAALIYTSLLLT